MSDEILIAAEAAVDEGAELLRRGRWHVDSVIAKGDRDYATKVDLEIEGVIARINVSALDGDLSIERVNGRVGVTQVAGRTLLTGINGAVRVVADTKNSKDLKIIDVNGSIELLFLGDVNADLRVEDIRGRVDPDLPNLVYDGERRRNDFRAKVGKGGTKVDVSDVNGRVRLASASKQDLLPATTASAK